MKRTPCAPRRQQDAHCGQFQRLAAGVFQEFLGKTVDERLGARDGEDTRCLTFEHPGLALFRSGIGIVEERIGDGKPVGCADVEPFAVMHDTEKALGLHGFVIEHVE